MNALLDELTWRGLIADSTDIDALAAHLDSGPISSYVGFDPTAASLHIGHLVQLLVARKIQEAGNRPILLVGGATGMIGDPKQTGERTMNPAGVVEEWTAGLSEQVKKYVDFSGSDAAIVVNNYDWVSKIPTLEFLRDVGKHFSVSRMLARDVVARRLERGISFTEFAYVLLQSMDYRELYRRYGVTLQTGAQDQWGNITAGANFIKRTEQATVHGLVTPLLTKADGTKFGKTESGTVWIDPKLTSPYAFHQFWLNTEDSKVIEMLKVFSPRGKEEIEELAREVEEAPYKRVAQRTLANDVTDLVHGEDLRKSAEKAAAALFGRGELAELDESTLDAVMGEVQTQKMECGSELPSVVDALAASGVVPSKGQARRTISEGGAYVNNRKVEDAEAKISEEDLLAGKYILLRRGKKTVGGVEIVK
ncbi:tyrosine--tRNA ligase [Propionimicrobium lymphophilum]|uniref:tyrosine--tRNA ligase n=1 Tax=Propionimicrobium lymphophilum TaxID=33012 RepID=UPI00254A37FD|nr:tyrosine--tRNA ligase [Propionimicrobium lymphophilum]MDK7710059.1 tyrosine--tRNA ligase [Propionimicrobium lymphophilum]MDK7732692.1 tyrosine--tRNA ligase [Propionimicrobium lymphophilum]